jgi:WD40 repeat protein
LRGCLTNLEEPPEPAEVYPTLVEPGGAREFDLRDRSFGDYELIEEVGRGGMGVVYRARQRSLHRIVALKMVLPSRLSSPEDVQRFKLEAEAAAQLDHPNVLPIYEVGEHQGQPYYTMKLVETGSLAVWRMKPEMRGAMTDTERRGVANQATIVTLMAKLAGAVAYAHGRGLLHRDLKPANILVDAQGEPYVADFGLAKFLARDTGLTLSVAMVGTPAYAAPEQARGGASRLTTAADIYSLGAILHELLTGRPPFQAETTLETYRAVLEQEVPRPRSLNPRIDRDLETITLKCLEKEPERRYPTAADLASDLDRYLRGDPIAARPVTTVGQLWRWCRRKPALAASLATLALVFTLGFVGVFTQWRRADANARAQLRENYYSSIALANAVTLSPDSHWIVASDASGQARLWDWEAEQELFTLGDRANRVRCWAFNPNKDELAVSMDPNGVQVLAVDTGKARLSLGPEAGRVVALAYDPDGRRLLTGGSDGTVGVWDDESGKPLNRLATTNQPIQRLAISPDGQRLVAVAERAAWVWELNSTKLIRAFPDDSLDAAPSLGTIFAVFADDGGERFVAIDTQGHLALWRDGHAPQHLATIRGGWPETARRAVFSRDGRWLCGAGERNTARLWDLTTGQEHLAIPDRVHDVVFSEDGQTMVTRGAENWATVWDVQQALKLKTLREHAAVLTSVAVSRDGRLVVTGDWRGTLKTWSAWPGRERIPGPTQQHATTCSPDGRLIATSPYSQGLVVLSSDSGRELLRAHRKNEDYYVAEFSPDSRRIVTVGYHKHARVWDAHSGQILLTLRGHRREVWAVDWSPDGRHIATGSFDATAKIWDAETGTELQTLFMNPQRQYAATGTADAVLWLAFDSSGSRLMISKTDGRVQLWDLRRGVVEAEWRAFDAVDAGVVEPHPDGRTVATFGARGEFRLWELPSARPLTTLRARGGTATGLNFDIVPDGQRLIAISSLITGSSIDSGTVEVWDLGDTPRQTLMLQGREPFFCMCFNPVLNRIVTGSADGAVYQWEAFPWESERYPEIRSRESAVGGQSGAEQPSSKLETRVRAYAREYWRARLKAERGPGKGAAWPEAQVIELPLDRSELPKRDPEARPDQIDLTDFYTGRLDEPFPAGGLMEWGPGDNDFSALPTGLRTYGGVAFDVRGVIEVRPTEPRGGLGDTFWSQYPDRVNGIRVDQECARLHLLLGTLGLEADGMVVGRLVLHGTDGGSAELELVYGRDVRDSWFDPREAATTDRGQVVWTGSNPVVELQGKALRLYATALENPRPRVKIASIDWVSAMSRSAPFVVAITLE